MANNSPDSCSQTGIFDGLQQEWPTMVRITHSDVTKIGKYAFAYSKLNSIVIPEGVVEINEGAFYECTSLKSVVIPASVTRIADDAFDECHPKCSISISPDNPAYDSSDSIL